MRETYKEKINNLIHRIKVVDDKILELTQTKLNMMMLMRDMKHNRCRTTLEECFTDELKELLNKQVDEE